MLMWTIWKERNARIFKDQKKHTDSLWEMLARNLKDTLQTHTWTDQDSKASAAESQILANWGIQPNCMHMNGLKNINFRPASPEVWHLPPEGCYKLNFDGASKGNPG